MAAATDYDAPRRNQSDDAADVGALDVLKTQRADLRSGTVDVDEPDSGQPVELPGSDLSFLSDEELSVPVVPIRAGEFTCTRCFLVHPRSRLARTGRKATLCRDCA